MIFAAVAFKQLIGTAVENAKENYIRWLTHRELKKSRVLLGKVNLEIERVGESKN